ncbi:MAG TPA: hypothetical protein EYF94_04270 [Porticoccaceae bacterium]|nr:hypothetical protein [Gammaproteobacteria bacterium]HIK80133.1 hypothetical protein [Porticoccaceae bacterium]
MAEFDLDYDVRPYFQNFHDRKERFACLVAHRRAGKTVACVYDLLIRALALCAALGKKVVNDLTFRGTAIVMMTQAQGVDKLANPHIATAACGLVPNLESTREN